MRAVRWKPLLVWFFDEMPAFGSFFFCFWVNGVGVCFFANDGARRTVRRNSD